MKYIKLFEEHSYSIYELITMAEYQAIELLIEEINKENPDLELIKDILDYSVVDINSKDSDDRTALMWATIKEPTYEKDEKVVELLLKHPQIDVNVQTLSGSTALMYATYWGKEKCVELLLNHPGIDVNLQNERGYTALMLAADNGYEKCVELLLNHPGINKIIKDKRSKTAWYYASPYIRQQFPQLNPNFR